MANDDPKKGSSAVLTEMGSTGSLYQHGFFSDDEVSRDLKWPYCLEKYKEMESDALIGGILFAFNQFIRSSKWTVEPYNGNDRPQDAEEKAEFVKQCLSDMAKPWNEVITDILSFLPYGHSVHEVVYKKRLGPNQSDKKLRSKYSDGLFGWRKMPVRSQETIEEFKVDSDGDLTGVVQNDLLRQTKVTIPADRLLLFRTSTYKDDPRGKSILRSAYRAYYFRKNIEMIEAIGIERNLAGLPVIHVPGELFDGTPENENRRKQFDMMGRNLKKNDQAYVLLPSDIYGTGENGSGEKQYSIELLQGSGSSNTNQNQTIERWDRRIAQSMLADFLLTGGQSVGSYSLASTKYDAFKTAIESYLDVIKEQINTKAIPELFKLNGFDSSKCPTLEHSGITEETLESLGSFLKNVNGLITPDENLEDMIRSRLNINKSPSDNSHPDPINEARNSFGGEESPNEEDSE